MTRSKVAARDVWHIIRLEKNSVEQFACVEFSRQHSPAFHSRIELFHLFGDVRREVRFAKESQTVMEETGDPTSPFRARLIVFLVVKIECRLPYACQFLACERDWSERSDHGGDERDILSRVVKDGEQCFYLTAHEIVRENAPRTARYGDAVCAQYFFKLPTMIVGA